MVMWYFKMPRGVYHMMMLKEKHTVISAVDSSMKTKPYVRGLL